MGALGSRLSLETKEKISLRRRNKCLGESNKASILTKTKVLTILHRYNTEQVSYETLAKKYKVSESTVRDIVTGKTWSHTTGVVYNPNRAANDRKARGESHGSSVLCKEDVLEIIALRGTGFYSTQALADRFNVSKSTITAILLGWTWGHVTGIEGSRKQNRKKKVITG